MIQYILECIAFQLVFLLIYDLFLKRETFFQWNRAYLITTYFLSLVLPWIKIEALRTEAPKLFQEYPDFFWNQGNAVVTAETGTTEFNISWEYVVLCSGMLLAMLFFAYKLYQIHRLRQKGEIHYFKDFTQVVISNSSLAFSFFKSIFLGDKIRKKEYNNIVAHELVHIKQKHSYDLLFFELMRILGWFNPLVYVYQNRISELHEFIADAQVAKSNKKEQYEFLLSQVFQTQRISFVNQFFKKSLIKKRIVMIQKVKSKRIFQLKYLVLAPIVLGMLLYSSCQFDDTQVKDGNAIKVADIRNLTLDEEIEIFTALKRSSENEQDWKVLVEDYNNVEIEFVKSSEGNYITGFNGEKIQAQMTIDSKTNLTVAAIFGKNDIYEGEPFGKVDEVPIFPGCEDDADPRACFQKMMQMHIAKNFSYPQEAQEQGVQGRVSIIFVIAKDGSIQGLRTRGPHKLLEDEALRIMRKLPKMQPGKQGGEIVNVPFSIPIHFKLEQSNFQTADWKADDSKPLIGDNPLYMMDGKEYAKEAFLEFEKTNSDKIQSIYIIKDKEVAMKKYGEKGRNGVVEVVLSDK